MELGLLSLGIEMNFGLWAWFMGLDIKIDWVKELDLCNCVGSQSNNLLSYV